MTGGPLAQLPLNKGNSQKSSGGKEATKKEVNQSILSASYCTLFAATFKYTCQAQTHDNKKNFEEFKPDFKRSFQHT